MEQIVRCPWKIEIKLSDFKESVHLAGGIEKYVKKQNKIFLRMLNAFWEEHKN